MIHEPFDALNAATIQRLVDNERAEHKRIDYKREIHIDTGDQRKEFLADVSSFANAGGGHLILGVEEKEGKPVAIPGIECPDHDALIQKLENLIRDGIAPRIPGIRTKALSDSPNNPVLVMEIPRSWNAPHMVVYKNTSRFFSRNSNGKYQLDVHEIRLAFESASGLENKIRDFRNERIGRIIAGETPVTLNHDGIHVILHILPVSAFDQPERLSAVMLYSQFEEFCPLGDATQLSRRVNIDGVVAAPSPCQDGCASYAQMFFTGCLEAVDTAIAGPHKAYHDVPIIKAVPLERSLLEGVKRYLEFMAECGIVPPLILSVALIGVKGCEVAGDAYTDSPSYSIDRDHLFLPEQMLMEYPDRASGVLRDSLDALWQASGYTHCKHFDANGLWRGVRHL